MNDRSTTPHLSAALHAPLSALDALALHATDAVQALADADAQARAALLAAAAPGAPGASWEAAQRARSALEAAATAAGLALARWIAVGGQVALEDPAPVALAGGSPEAARAPEPPAADPVAKALVAPDPAPAPEPAPPVEAPAAGDATVAPEPTAGPVPAGPPASAASLEALAQGGIGAKRRKEEDAIAERAAAALKRFAKLHNVHPRDTPAVASPLLDLTRGPLSLVAVHHRTAALTAVVAALRAAQEAGVREAGPLVQRARDVQRKADVAYVHGLAREHGPLGASWADDVTATLHDLGLVTAPARPAPPSPEALLAAVTPDLGAAALRRAVRAALDGGVAPTDKRLLAALAGRVGDLTGTDLKAVRKAHRQRTKASPSKAPADDAHAPGPDWPFWHLTRGRRAAVVGGDPREDARQRLQEAFGFASLDWVDPAPRKLGALKARVAGGRLHVVLINRYAGHTVDNALLRGAVADDLSRWVRTESYGVRAVREAMEAHWRSLSQPAAPSP